MNEAAALIFGAFNPPTNAHIRIAELLLEKNSEWDIIFIPSKDVYITDWKKYDADNLIHERERFELLKKAVGDRERIFVSDVELDPRYALDGKTYNTVNYYKKLYKKIYIVIGDEKVSELSSWYKGQELMRENSFLVLCREHRRPDTVCGLDHEYLEFDGEGISSTMIRNAVREGRLSEVKDFVPKCVYEWLQDKVEENV